MVSVPQIDRYHLEPRCRVCRNDEVCKKVNDLLASGASYAMILRALGDDNGAEVTSDSIRRHAERHFPVQNVAKATYREILERRAKENSVDLVRVAGRFARGRAYSKARGSDSGGYPDGGHRR